MKLNKLIIPLIVVALAICSEYLPEFFKHIPFRYKVPDNAGYEFNTTYRDAVWYFVYGLLILSMVVIIHYQLPRDNIAGKLLMCAPIAWFAIEFYEKFCFLAKINDNRLYINYGSKWQIFIVLFIILFIIRLYFYGIRKSK